MDSAFSAAISIAFHGTAFAMVLYLVSVGLSVTMGLMGFVNLAHGVFAVAGGYFMTMLMMQFGVSFYLAVPAAMIGVAVLSVPLERFLYRPLYGADELDQVLMTMGLVFMSLAVGKYFWGPTPQPFSRRMRSAARSISSAAASRPIAVSSSVPARSWSRSYGSASIARASAHRFAQPSITGAWRNRSASTRRSSSPSPLRSAARSPRSAAGWAPRSWRSIPATRSSIWSIS